MGFLPLGHFAIIVDIEAASIHYGDHDLTVTVSGGVAQRGPESDTPDAMLKHADDALYEAKRTGRNRICVASSCRAPVPT